MLPVDLKEFIQAVGYIGLFAIIFAESGLFFAFFLPGDSLLFTAGFLASQGYLSLPVLIVGCAIAAVAGNAIGYAFGRHFGRPLFERPDSRWFKRKYLIAAEEFYEKHGAKTIVLARFLPGVRTFAPIVAGAANMRYRRFASFNVIGTILWAIGLPVGGYWLGAAIPDPDRYLLPIIGLIIIISVLPTAFHVWQEHRHDISSAWRNRGKPAPAAERPDPSERLAGGDD